jgi:hypothetical protein
MVEVLIELDSTSLLLAETKTWSTKSKETQHLPT